MDLNFKIENQIITRVDRKSVVNFSEKYLKLDFEFSKDWNNLDKYILIYHDDKVTRLAVTDDTITLSSRFVSSKKLVFMLYGVIVEDDEVVYRITTNQLRINLINCNFTKDYDEDLDPVIDADIIEQLWAAINSKEDIGDLADVATSGSYTDLKDKPVIPSDVSDLTDTQNTAFTPKSHTHTKSEISDFPSLANVATSGSYNDLSNKPSIPTVVNVVEYGNSNAVSSDAVYDCIQSVIGNANQWLTS